MNEIEIMQSMTASSGGSTTFILSIVFSIVGIIYFGYGKKREGGEFFYYSGIGLMVFPYIVTEQSEMIAIGILLILSPLLMRIL